MYMSIFVIVLITQTSSASPPTKHVFFQIDEFIKQLMTSEKFDELADVIADKAAQKIRKMENNDTKVIDKESLRIGEVNKNVDLSLEKNFNHEDMQTKVKGSKSNERPERDHEISKAKELTDTKSKYDYEKNKGKDSRSKEKSNNDQESDKKNDARSNEKLNAGRDTPESQYPKKDINLKPVKFGKIDTRDFFNIHKTSEELELNYKHLTGEIGKHRYNVKNNNLKKQKEIYEKEEHTKYNENHKAADKHENESDKNDNLHIKSANSREAKSDSKELKISDHSSYENKAHEQSTFHEDERRNSGEKISINDTDSTNPENKHDFKYKAKISYEKPRVEGEDTEKSDEITKLNENYDSTKTFAEELKGFSQEMTIPRSSSKEIVEVKLYRANSEDKSQSHENLSISMLIPNTSQIKHGKLVREENGKYFTLDTSVEYAEYHENIAKQNQLTYIRK